MSTPRGLFELKYFFTSGYTTAEGESVSNESVRQAIAEIVKAENPRTSAQRPGYRDDVVRTRSADCASHGGRNTASN